MHTRCTECRWVDEADSTAGTSFKGVELCPTHATRPGTPLSLREAVIILTPDEARDLIEALEALTEYSRDSTLEDDPVPECVKEGEYLADLLREEVRWC